MALQVDHVLMVMVFAALVSTLKAFIKKVLLRLTLIRVGFLVHLKSGGGWISPPDFLSFNMAIFGPNQFKPGLK